MTLTCVYGSYTRKRSTRNFKRQLFDSRCNENHKNQRLKWILSAEMQTADDRNCAIDSPSMNYTVQDSFQGAVSLDDQRRGLRQTSLWRYFRRKQKTKEQKYGPDEQEKVCHNVHPPDKLFSNFSSTHSINKPSSVGMNPLVNALNGLCLMD